MPNNKLKFYHTDRGIEFFGLNTDVLKNLEFLDSQEKKVHIYKRITASVSTSKGTQIRDLYIIPRYWGLFYAQKNQIKIKDRRKVSKSSKISTSAETTVSLSSEQKNVYTLVCQQLDKFGSSIINVGTGYGKTYISLALYQYLQVRTLYITPRNNILKQTQRVRQSFGIRNENFIERSFQALYSKNNDISISNIDLIIIDEIHTLPSPKYINILWDYCNKVSYTLGLSATIDERNDGKDDYYIKFLANQIVAENDLDQENNTENLRGKGRIIYFHDQRDTEELHEFVNLTKYDNNDKIEGKEETLHMIKTLQKIYENSQRIEIIYKQIKKLLKYHNNIIVFSRIKYPLTELQKLLEQRKLSHMRTYLFMGDTNDNWIDYISKNANILLTTYQFCDIGFSEERFTACIFADPKRTKMKQPLGRILRTQNDASTSAYQIRREAVFIIDAETFMQFNYPDNIKDLLREKSWKIKEEDYFEE